MYMLARGDCVYNVTPTNPVTTSPWSTHVQECMQIPAMHMRAYKPNSLQAKLQHTEVQGPIRSKLAGRHKMSLGQQASTAMPHGRQPASAVGEVVRAN